MNKKMHVHIVGLGKVGLALANCLSNTHKVSVSGRNITRIEQQLRQYNIDAQAQPMRASIDAAQVVLIAVSDTAISSVAQQLAPLTRDGHIIAHCSGAQTSEVLSQAIQKQQRHYCSLHPLNTFPNDQASVDLLAHHEHNTRLYCEGDPHALEITTPLFESVGFKTVVIDQAAKRHYHAACVMACNYLTALMDASLEIAESAGINRDTFWESIQPLIHATLDNIDQSGTTKALSGPIARADIKTVQQHLDALKEQPILENIYRALGKQATQIANEQLSEHDAQVLNTLFAKKT